MKLIVGLGNPGKEYKETRHNVGFMVLDKLQDDLKLSEFSYSKKFDADVSKNKKVVLLKPQTFMNSSGFSVAGFMNFYKIKPKDVLIIHDDVDFDLGKIKIGFNEGPAGHNGIKSIFKETGLKDYWRFRVGINSSENRKTEDFVLNKFSKNEQVLLAESLFLAVKELKEIINSGKIEKTKLQG
ncbi:aminoacyl-tRNA hydrolase [bacterium]|nr:aminoacyl-tRNA hydrolase [bacterium]